MSREVCCDEPASQGEATALRAAEPLDATTTPGRSASLRNGLILVFTAVGLVLLLAALYYFRTLVLAALIGVGSGVLIAPVIKHLQIRANVPRSVSVLTAVVLLFAIVGAAGYGLYTIVADQIEQLVKQGPGIIDSLQERFSQFYADFPWIGEPNGQLSTALQRVGEFFFAGLKTSAAFVTLFFTALIVGVFVAVNAGGYFRGFLSAFPARMRPRVEELGHSSAKALRAWFLSQLVVMAISGIATAIALWIIGVDYWLLLGVLTGLLGFIPYIGSILTGLAACLVTLGTQPEKFWWVLVVYVIIQQLESEVTLPIVMKNRIRLPEAHLLIFTLIMGAAFGFIGVFVAPGVFAVLHHLYVKAYVPWVDRKGAVQAR